MNSDILAPFKDDFATLIETGFIAVKQLDEASATKIFQGAKILDPDNAASDVGLGYIALNKLEIEYATKIFTDVLKEHPDHHLAQTFLAMCKLLTHGKQEEGEEDIQKIMKKTDDETVVNLCKICLKWSEKDLKKTKAPFFAAKKPEEDSQDSTEESKDGEQTQES